MSLVFEDDVTTTVDEILTTSNVSDKATPGVTEKTPDPKQALRVMAIVNIIEQGLKFVF